MHRQSYLITIVTLIVCGLFLEKDNIANAASSKTYQSRVSQLSWKHPYWDDSIAEFENGSKIFNYPSDNGSYLRTEYSEKLYKSKSMPKEIRGTWYISKKDHFKITKHHYTLTKLEIRDRGKHKNYDSDPVNTQKQGYYTTPKQDRLFTKHNKKVKRIYELCSYSPKMGRYSTSTIAQIRRVNIRRNGKNYQALMAYVGEGKSGKHDEIQTNIIYHKYYKNLPKTMWNIRYYDVFGMWSSPAETKAELGQTIPVSEIYANNRLYKSRINTTSGAIISADHGGNQAIQYITKVKHKSIPQWARDMMTSY